MSTMLEQAIIDAQTLREAAIKNAESAIVEKYSAEVKTAVESLLEQDEEEMADPLADLGGDDALMGMGEEEPESTAMEQVPMAHLADDEEVVVVDLDDIVAAAEEEPELDDDTLELDRQEIADEVGISLDAEAPGNRDDEIDLDEGELLDIFKEMLNVDVPEIEVEQSKEELEQEDHEEDQEISLVRSDGMDEDDIEEHERNMAKYESLQRDYVKMKKTLNKVQKRLQESNLVNARLLYANRVLSTHSLNEQQKNRIVEMVKNARSVDEAKMVFETLRKTMATDSKRSTRTQSLSEAVTRPSSVILGHRPRENNKTERNPTITRWATLAGLKNK